MLTALKSARFEKLFAVYNRNLIKRRFHAVCVANLAELKRKDPRIPLVIYANHSSWWDGLAAFEISRLASLDAFVMMEEKNLERLFLFRRIGAFSVDRERPRKALESLAYAARLLGENPCRALWIFPQGKILPNERRPLFFYAGLSRIVESFDRIQTVPVAFRYEFLNEFKPEIFIKIGRIETIEKPADFDSKAATENFARRLTVALDRLRDDISRENFSEFERVI